jgi:uncharacterized protein YegL
MASNEMDTSNNSEWVDLGGESTTTKAGNEVIDFTVLLQKIRSISLFSDEPQKMTEAKEQKNDEYLLTLSSEIQVDKFPWLQQVREEAVEFVLILDMSGSMSGKPWSQVQTAMTKITEMTSDNAKITVKTMVYNQNAEFLKSHGDRAATEVKQIRAGGSTNFVSVFNLLKKHLEDGGGDDGGMMSNLKKKLIPSSSKPKNDEKKKKVFVFFLTDGCDTCNNAQQIMVAKEHLQESMATYGEEVIVNVLGFSENHDDAFLESLSLLGTSDGSYSFVQTNDGDQALQKRLTDLLESTTGLVGKSVFLDLKLENPGALFLGEWFGEGKNDIALQAFIQIDGSNTAKISTTKFVRIPAGAEETFRITIKMVRDLRDGSNQVEAAVRKVKVQDKDLAITESQKLELRKLRTSLNLITARLSNSVEDGATDMDKVVKLAKSWYDSVVEYNKAVKPNTNDEEVNKLAEAVNSGLTICGNVLQEQDGESADGYQRRVRGAHTTYNLSSCQSHNVMQVKKKMVSGKGPSRGDRQQMQQKQAYMD